MQIAKRPTIPSLRMHRDLFCFSLVQIQQSNPSVLSSQPHPDPKETGPGALQLWQPLLIIPAGFGLEQLKSAW